MADAPLRLQARLDHVQLRSAEPARLAEFYHRALDMKPRKLDQDLWLCDGPARRIVIASGRPRTLGFGAYAVADQKMLAALREHIGQRGVKLSSSPSPLFDQDAFMVEDPDGHQIVFGLATPEPAPGTGSLPARLQHLVLGSDQVAAMTEFYEQVLGFTVSDRVFDKSGKLTNCFFRADRGDHHVFAIFPAAEKRLDHHCYESVDWGRIRDWADWLSDREIPIVWGPGRHGPGANLFIMVRDPDGNWVEISAELEQVERDRPAGVWEHSPLVANRWGQPRLTG